MGCDVGSPDGISDGCCVGSTNLLRANIIRQNSVAVIITVINYEHHCFRWCSVGFKDGCSVGPTVGLVGRLVETNTDSWSISMRCSFQGTVVSLEHLTVLKTKFLAEICDFIDCMNTLKPCNARNSVSKRLNQTVCNVHALTVNILCENASVCEKSSKEISIGMFSSRIFGRESRWIWGSIFRFWD